MANRSVEQKANKAAEAFVDRFYASFDSNDRLNRLPSMYSPEARVVWNGNGISGPQEIMQLLTAMPSTRHEVQSFDAHMIPGSIGQGKPVPTLAVTVSGQVRYSGGPFPPNWRMPSSANVHPGEDPAKLPRVFSQSFMLQPGPEDSYRAIADCFRFVG